MKKILFAIATMTLFLCEMNAERPEPLDSEKIVNLKRGLRTAEQTKLADNLLKVTSDHPDVNRYFKTNLDAHRNDLPYINCALAIMIQYGILPEKGSIKTVDEYARIAYANPSEMNYYSAIAYGLLMKKEADELDKEKVQERTDLRKKMHEAFQKAFAMTKSNKEKAELSFIVAQGLSCRLDDRFENDRTEIEKWEADQQGVIKYCEDAIDMDPDHYSACANYKIMQTYLRIANAYYKDMGDNNIYDRKLCLELYIQVIEYGNDTFREADRLSKKNIQEQNGVKMASYMEWAGRDAQQPSAIANSLMRIISNYEVQMEKRNVGLTPAQQEQLRRYNEYKAKKKAEEEFWRGVDAKQPSATADSLSKTISKMEKRNVELTPFEQQERLRKFNEYMAKKREEEESWKGK